MVTQINKGNFREEVKNSDLPVLIDFWAPWCGPCQAMAPVFEELSSEYEGKLKFVKLNTDEEAEISSEYGIQGIPCLILTKEGKEIDRIVGFAVKDILKQKIDEILDKV